jgi:hypothetical protein
MQRCSATSGRSTIEPGSTDAMDVHPRPLDASARYWVQPPGEEPTSMADREECGEVNGARADDGEEDNAGTFVRIASIDGPIPARSTASRSL